MDSILSALAGAPVANLLVLGGLGFLALAVVAKISGKIEVSQNGRYVSGVLGVVLLATGLLIHPASPPQSAANPPQTLAAPTAVTITAAPTPGEIAATAPTPLPEPPTALPAPTATAIASPTMAVPNATSAAPPTVAAPISDTGSAPMPSGAVWQRLGDLPRQINSLVVDPNRPEVLYAGTGESGSGSGVFATTDSGVTWQLAANGLPSEDVNALGIAHSGSPILYAVVGVRQHLWTSTDDAATWSKVSEPDLPSAFETVLVVDPASDRKLYYLSRGFGLSRSLDGGHSWTPLKQGLPVDDQGKAATQSLAIDPSNPNVMYTGTGGFVGGGHGVFKSTDGGDTWTSANQGMIDYRVTAVAVDPGQPSTVFAGADAGELFKSTDGGQTWTDITAALQSRPGDHNTVQQIIIDPNPPHAIYLLRDRADVVVSQDGGESWQTLGQPQEAERHEYTAMAISWTSPPIIVVGAERSGAWRLGP